MPGDIDVGNYRILRDVIHMDCIYVLILHTQHMKPVSPLSVWIKMNASFFSRNRSKPVCLMIPVSSCTILRILIFSNKKQSRSIKFAFCLPNLYSVYVEESVRPKPLFFTKTFLRNS